MRFAERILRWTLACFLIVSSGDVFFRFFEYPEPTPEAQLFLISLTAAGFVWPLAGLVMLTSGVLLFFRNLTGLSLVMTAPIAITMIAYHLTLDPSPRNALGTISLTALLFALGAFHLRAFRSLVGRD